MPNAIEAFVMKAFAPLFREESPGRLYLRGARTPSIKRLASLFETHRLSDLLPYEAYDEDHGLFFNSDTYGFALEISTAVGLDDNTLGILSGIFNNDSFGKDTIIQHCLYASPDVMPILSRWGNTFYKDAGKNDGVTRPRNSNIFRTIARRRAGMFIGANWHSMSPHHSLVARDFRSFLTVQFPYPEGNRKNVNKLMRSKAVSNRDDVKAILKTAGLASKNLDASALVDLIDTMLNVKPIKRERRRYDEDELLRSQMVCADTGLLVGRDDLFLKTPKSKTHVSIFGVDKYPERWAGWQNGELIGSLFEEARRISTPFLVTMTLTIPDQLEQLSQAKIKQLRSVKMSESQIAKAVPSWHQKRDEWNFVVNKMEEGHSNVQVNYQVVLFTTDENKERAENELESTYKANGWNLHKQQFTLLPAFLMSLPLGASQQYTHFARRVKMFKTMPSWSTVNISPWIGEWKGSPNPLQLLCGPRGQLMNFNPWDNDGNFNVAVAARPGAGKSVFIQDLVLSILGQGGRSWVFDRGRSFEPLCRLLGEYFSTQFLVFDGSEHVSLNPFTNVRVWDSENPSKHDADVPDEVRKQSGSERVMIHNLLMQMAVRDSQPLPAERQTWLEVALSHAWEAKGRDTEITDIYDILHADEDVRKRDLADAIQPFTRDGIYGHYFRGPSTIDLSHDFVVLEMKELDDRPHLQTIVLLMLVLRIEQTMYSADRNRRKQACIIDEAWKLLRHGDAATFVEEGYRTARKYGSAFISITQGINDFYGNPTTQACLENSDWTVLLAQKDESIKQLSKSDRLPGGQESINIIRHLKTVKGAFSECAIISPQGLTPARLIIDKFSEMLFTTNNDDVVERQALQQQGLSLVEALEQLAANREQPNGQ